jgi:hypothetical protein
VQLVLACSRTTADDLWASRIKTLAGQVLDWDLVLYLGGVHTVVPLLHRNLSIICPEAVPASALKQLRDEAYRIASRNVLLTTELLSILNLLEVNGVSAMPYKGPALAHQVYGDFRLRNFADLDILIRQSDLAKARRVLAEHGYEPQLQMTAAKERAILQSECDEAFARDNGDVLLELHWAITPPFFSFPLSTEDLFHRSITIELLGKKVPAPSVEDLLLILCVNGTKDKWGRLEFICRVAELLRRYPSLDWEKTFASAHDLGAERMLLLGLFLAQHVLDAALPEAVSERVRKETILKRLASDVCELLFVRPTDVVGQFELTMFRLRSRERLRDRLTYCFKRALAPTYKDIETWTLPRSLEFLYPLVRPIRLIRLKLSRSEFVRHQSKTQL